MKLPNSYGSVIKLGGKRRKPYAVRISKLVEDDTGKVKRKYTYLAYTYGTYMHGKTQNETPAPRWQTHLCFTYGQHRSK